MRYFDYAALPAFAGEGGVGASARTTKKIRGRDMDRALAAVRLSRAEEALERAVGDLADGRAAEERLSEEDKQGSADDVKKRALLAEVTRLATIVKILNTTTAAGHHANTAEDNIAILVNRNNLLAIMAELCTARCAALAGGVTQEDVDAAYACACDISELAAANCIVEGDNLPDTLLCTYLSGLEKRADDLKKFAKLKSGETEAAVEGAISELAAVEGAISELAAAKGETGWFGLSRSTWAGAAAGYFVGVFLACGVLSTPAALAAVGLAGASALVLVSASLATLAVAAVIGGAIGAGMNWVHGWVERESAKAAVTGAGAGMLLWAAGIIAGSIYPPIATAFIGFVAATPVTLGVAAGVVLVPAMLVGCGLGAAFGAAWSYFRSGSSISAKDAAADTPGTPESAELSPS